jgi:hypothetical protein
MKTHVKTIYECHAKKATKDLVTFLNTLRADSHDNETPIYVTYFDEAGDLGSLLEVLMRLLSNQDESTTMWYVFMTTKSNVSYFHPTPKNSKSYVPPFFNASSKDSEFNKVER